MEYIKKTLFLMLNVYGKIFEGCSEYRIIIFFSFVVLYFYFEIIKKYIFDTFLYNSIVFLLFEKVRL